MVGAGVGRGIFLLEAENHCSHIAGIKTADNGLGAAIVFGGENMSCLQDVVKLGDLFEEALGLGSLQDGPEGLLVDSVHDQHGVRLVPIGEGKVVDADAPLAVVLLQGVHLIPHVHDGGILFPDFIL